MVLKLAALNGNLLFQANYWAPPRLVESETLELGPSNLIFTNPSGDPDGTFKVDNPGYKGALCEVNLHFLIKIFRLHILEITFFLFYCDI